MYQISEPWPRTDIIGKKSDCLARLRDLLLVVAIRFDVLRARRNSCFVVLCILLMDVTYIFWKFLFVKINFTSFVFVEGYKSNVQ